MVLEWAVKCSDDISEGRKSLENLKNTRVGRDIDFEHMLLHSEGTSLSSMS